MSYFYFKSKAVGWKKQQQQQHFLFFPSENNSYLLVKNGFLHLCISYDYDLYVVIATDFHIV